MIAEQFLVNGGHTGLGIRIDSDATGVRGGARGTSSRGGRNDASVAACGVETWGRMHGCIGNIECNSVPVPRAGGVGGRCDEIHLFEGGIVNSEVLPPGVVVFKDPAVMITRQHLLITIPLPRRSFASRAPRSRTNSLWC